MNGTASTGAMLNGKMEKSLIRPMNDQTLTNKVQVTSPPKKNEVNLVFLEEDHSVALTAFLILINRKVKLPNVKRMKPACINVCIAVMICILMYGRIKIAMMTKIAKILSAVFYMLG